MDHEKPRPERAPEPKDDARVVAHRCPFCHEAVRPDVEAWVACAQCLGRQHAACWDESGRCGACAHEQRLEAPAAAPASRGRRLTPVALVVVALVALLLVGGLLGLLAVPADVPAPAPVAVRTRPRELVERPVESPGPSARSEAERLADLQQIEVHSADAREIIRLRAAARDGPGSRDDELFEWLPDRGDAAGVDLARRMAREARERISGRQDELRNLILEAHLQERVGDPVTAVTRCNEALDLDPRSGLAWTVRGWAWLARGDLNRAELDLRRGRRLSTETTWVYIGLGRVAEGRGDEAAAIEHYETALRGTVARSVPVDHRGDLLARIERLSAMRSSPRRR